MPRADFPAFHLPRPEYDEQATGIQSGTGSATPAPSTVGARTHGAQSDPRLDALRNLPTSRSTARITHGPQPLPGVGAMLGQVPPTGLPGVSAMLAQVPPSGLPGIRAAIADASASLALPGPDAIVESDAWRETLALHPPRQTSASSELGSSLPPSLPAGQPMRPAPSGSDGLSTQAADRSAAPLFAPRPLRPETEATAGRQRPADADVAQVRARGVVTKTARGHVSEEGRALVLELERAGWPRADICSATGLTYPQVRNVLEHAAAQQAEREPGVLTPRGRHVSGNGAARMRELRAMATASGQPMSFQQIATTLGVNRRTVRNFFERDRIPEPAPGVRDGRNVTEAAIREILRLRDEEHLSYYDIGRRLGLQKGTVEGIIRRERG